MDNEIRTDTRPENDGGEGNITVKRNKTVDFIAKIACLILAFFLWYYASSLDTVIYDEEFTSVAVEIENESSLSLLSGDGMTVDVTLSGKRNALRKINSTDIRAYATVPEGAAAGRHELEIIFDVPSGVSFEKSSASSVVVYVDNSISKPIPVKVNIGKLNHETDCELRSGTVSDVTVTGPAQIIDRIEYASLEVDMGNQLISKSFSYRGDLVLIDDEGEAVSSNYVKISSPTVSVTVSVLKERNVPIVVKFRGGFITADDCRITLSRSTVRVKGDAETVKDMVIECVIDERTLRDNVTVSRGISLPSGVTNLDNVYNVDVTVDITTMTERTFTVTPVAVNGTAEGEIAPLTVTVRGRTELIGALTSSDIKATVDLTGVSGRVTLPVTFNFEGEFAGKVHETYSSDAPYEVSVTVTETTRGR